MTLSKWLTEEKCREVKITYDNENKEYFVTLTQGFYNPESKKVEKFGQNLSILIIETIDEWNNKYNDIERTLPNIKNE